MRVEKPEVGKTYWSKSGRQFRIYATDGSREYPIHAAELIDDGWRVCTMSADNVHLYDADPTKPDPLLPIDLTKRWRRRDGGKVWDLKRIGDHLSYSYAFNAARRSTCFVDLAGKHSNHSVADLVPDDEPALPPLDLTKPVKRRDGLQIRNVRLSDDGKRITYEVIGIENLSTCAVVVSELNRLLAELEAARAEIERLRAFVQSCADDLDDTVSPGRKEQAKTLTGTAGRS